MTQKTCPICGETFTKPPNESGRQWARRKHCSVDCHKGWRGQVARVIAGETRITDNGYRQTYLPMHPANRRYAYAYEHRLVMERTIGRFLASDEYVHHVNEDKLDNRPENLRLLTGSVHQVEHRSGVHDELIIRCLRRGWTHREIVALGVAGHRVCRIRQSLRVAA